MRRWVLVSLFLTFGLSATRGADSSSDMEDSMEGKRLSKPRIFRWEGRDGSAPVKPKRSETKSSRKLRIFKWKKESGAYAGEAAGKKKKSRKVRAKKERKGKKKPRIFRWEKDPY